ncbi:MAG: hypothetical protein KGJ58_04320 [Patescibacteria group bacterium]|nr:hypothetical protein [Patescibacteria group bacterium]MDE1988233.1 hypothetical protein [Patescibacteria group bacterium]MDE2218642.1 hypothetical protein [Patescibacteria group bacterium]
MEQDKEISAMNEIIASLNNLDDGQRQRVMKYVLERFGVPVTEQINAPIMSPVQKPAQSVGYENTLNTKIVDIRTFKEEKSPRSAIQMAVLVAFYLQEIAPSDERKVAIDSTDIEKYFKQANYKLPSGKNGAADTLVNAKRAGYFEIADRGTYKLNPVGYNLIAHSLPNGDSEPRKARAKTKAKKAKKSKK